jgi:beta-galactosidase
VIEDPPAGLEAVRRRRPDGTGYLFLLNHTGSALRVAGEGTDLITGDEATGEVLVPAGGVVVLRTGPTGGEEE